MYGLTASKNVFDGRNALNKKYPTFHTQCARRNYHKHIYFRYCAQNNKLSTQTWKYNRILPLYLHQRPHEFIVHVWKRLAAAKQLDHHPYEITSGDNPTCSCEDFQRHSYPCKHILKQWITSEGELDIPNTLSDPWWSIDESVMTIQDKHANKPRNT